MLVPTLHPGDMVIADHLNVHKVAGVRLAIERIETRWPLLGACLPRFSADECQTYFRHCGYTGAKRL